MAPNHQLPNGFRTATDGTLACPHRDLSVCGGCADHPAITEVLGAYYHDPDGAIAAEVAAMLATPDATTYAEACEWVERQHAATGGLVTGGSFMIRFDSGYVAEVALAIVEVAPGVTMARPVR